MTVGRWLESEWCEERKVIHSRHLLSVLNGRSSHKAIHPSGEDLADDVAVDVGQATVDAVVAERQLLMVDAQQMQNGRVQVVAVRLTGAGLVGQLVAGPISDAGLDGRPRPPSHGRAAIAVAA